MITYANPRGVYLVGYQVNSVDKFFRAFQGGKNEVKSD